VVRAGRAARRLDRAPGPHSSAPGTPRTYAGDHATTRRDGDRATATEPGFASAGPCPECRPDTLADAERHTVAHSDDHRGAFSTCDDDDADADADHDDGTDRDAISDNSRFHACRGRAAGNHPAGSLNQFRSRSGRSR